MKRLGFSCLTVDLGARMNNAALCVTEHRVADSVFVTEKRLVMFAFFYTVHLHSVITFRGEEVSTFIVKVERDDGGGLPWLLITPEVLFCVSMCLRS